MTEQELKKIESYCKKATPNPLDFGVISKELDPVEWFRQHLSYGKGDVWCVWCPEHPDTIEKTTGKPEHAVLFCITGNGPTSEQNAEFIIRARKDVPKLLAAIRELQAENERLRKEIREAARDAAAEENWKHKQGEDYGSY